MSTTNPPRIGTITRFRNYFLTGLIICAPLAITVYITWSIVQWFDDAVKPYVPEVYNPDTYLPFTLPGFGLLVAIFVITLIGFFAANYIGRTLVAYGEVMLGRMPFVRNIYSGLKQIFQTVLSDKSDSFKKVGLIEYPRKGLYALVFIATDTDGEVGERLKGRGDEAISVFLPTTPNPTSGFLLFVPKRDAIILDMSVEDAAKLVISAGLVSPEYQKRAAKIAKQTGFDRRHQTPEPALNDDG